MPGRKNMTWYDSNVPKIIIKIHSREMYNSITVTYLRMSGGRSIKTVFSYIRDAKVAYWVIWTPGLLHLMYYMVYFSEVLSKAKTVRKYWWSQRNRTGWAKKLWDVWLNNMLAILEPCIKFQWNTSTFVQTRFCHKIMRSLGNSLHGFFGP